MKEGHLATLWNPAPGHKDKEKDFPLNVAYAPLPRPGPLPR